MEQQPLALNTERLNTMPRVKFGAVSNVFVKQIHFTKSEQIESGHKHIYDHMSLLAKGSVKVVVDGKETIFHAPTMVYMNKDVMHSITALEDDTVWYCIHAIRKGDYSGDIVDEDMVPVGVNALDYMGELTAKGIVERRIGKPNENLSPEDEEILQYLQARDALGNLSNGINVQDPTKE